VHPGIEQISTQASEQNQSVGSARNGTVIGLWQVRHLTTSLGH
jgi:hypothetical protein